MLAALLGALGDSLLKALFNVIQAELQRRALIEQGRAAQHTDDLQAAVQEGKDAAKTDEDVRRMGDGDLDAALRRVRSGSSPASHR